MKHRRTNPGGTRLAPHVRSLRWALFTVLAGLLVSAGLLALGQVTRGSSALDNLPAGYGSTRVAELQERVSGEGASTAVVLYAKSSALTAGDLARLQKLTVSVASDPKVTGDQAGQGARLAALQPSDDGTAAIAVLPVADVPDAASAARVVGELRDSLREQLPPGVQASVTGPTAINADLSKVFDGANLTLLWATAAIVGVLLIITYRSPVLWVVPLTVVAVADQVAGAAATRVLQLFDIAWGEDSLGIMSVLVFGAGTNYALLLISRYRDALKSHDDRLMAMSVALRGAAESILASASTVILGLLTLVLSLVPSSRGLGVACAVGIAIACLYVVVILPAVLVLAGRWVFWPKVPKVGDTATVDSRNLWARLRPLIARSPRPIAFGAAVFLMALAAGVPFIQSGLAPSDQFLRKPEAITAAERLAQSFPGGEADPTVVYTPRPEALTRELTTVPGIARVTPAPGPQADGLSQLSIVLEATPGSPAARDAVQRIQSIADDMARTWVGGTEATSVDQNDAAQRDRAVIIPVVLLVVFVSLTVLLRSAVAPILLVASVVGTYFASLGLSWWIFTNIFDFQRMDVTVPLFAFLFLVALGVDYNIFLVARAAQEAKRSGPAEGMLRALIATGGVITSAGILLAAVFAVLGVLPLVALAQIGAVICIGVLLDTLLVRTFLVPSLAIWLGDAFWWPRRFARHAPSDTQDAETNVVASHR